MQGSFKRFISEWQLPSVLLVRVGFPFIAGIYDVKPKIDNRAKSSSGGTRVTALGLSLSNALFTTTLSCIRYFSYRSFTIGICYALYSTKVSFLQDVALEAESSERHTDFSIRQSLKLAGVPNQFADSFTSAKRATAEDLYRFKTESMNNSGFFSVLSSYLQRHLLSSTLSSIHSYIISRWIVRKGVDRYTNPNRSFFKEYISDIEHETHGIATRRWQLRAMIGSNFGQAVGSALGAAIFSLFSPKTVNSADAVHNQSNVKNQELATFLMFVGEFLGGVVGLTAFRAWHLKSHNLAARARDEEILYQFAMGEMMGYNAATQSK